MKELKGLLYQMDMINEEASHKCFNHLIKIFTKWWKTVN